MNIPAILPVKKKPENILPSITEKTKPLHDRKKRFGR